MLSIRRRPSSRRLSASAGGRSSVMAKTPDDDHRELVHATGSVIRTWAETEWILMTIMAMIAGCDLERARIIWASTTSFRAKRDLLSRMGEAFLADRLLPEFRDIISKVKHLSEKRNLIAHDRAYHIKMGTFRFMNDQDATQPNTFGRYRDVQVSTIRIWAKENEELSIRVMNFSQRIGSGTECILEQPRVIPEPDQDRAPEVDPDQDGGAERKFPPPPSLS